MPSEFKPNHPIKHLLRNSIQFLLIRFARAIKPFLSLKIVLFSWFIAEDCSIFLLKKSHGCYLLHAKDIGVSRRIYIGLNDEYLKAVKSIEWIAIIRSDQAGGGGLIA